MQVDMVPVASITPYAGNAKLHAQEQIDNVAASIRQYGFVQPLVLDDNGVIVIGHCRYEAAKMLGMEEVPCVIAAELGEEQINALRLADNKLNESAWDMDMLDLALECSDFGELDLDWGVGVNDIEYMDFDGGGDGGGSRMSRGSKVRVVIGPIMFDLDDSTHELYEKCKKLDESRVKAKMADLLDRGWFA